MPKNDMKATDYYKSGRMREAGIKGGLAAAKMTMERLQARVSEYDENPRKCQYCQKALTYQQRHNKFCSISCSSTAANLVNYPERAKKLSREDWVKSFLDRPFEDLAWDSKRVRVLEEQEGKCASCGIDEWCGQKLTLQVDHKDGDNTNDARENLEALCPNCHSLTPTFCGKNAPRYRGDKKVEDDVLIYALQNTSSIRQALLMVGLTPKGNNYKRAKKLYESIGIVVK